MKQKKRVYISGPMTDPKTGKVSDENLTAFRRAHSLLSKEGYRRVTNPINVWVCRWPWMYRALERIVGKETAYRVVLMYDIMLMLRCDMIYKIPGWRESRGAQIESCVAFHLGVWPLPSKVRERVDKKLAKAMEKWRKTDALQCAERDER